MDENREGAGIVIKGAWAMIFPNGAILADSAFKNTADAWKVGLGWPSEEEIERAKKSGHQVKWVKISHD